MIIGSGGHSKVIVDIVLKERKYSIAGFIDGKVQKGNKVLGYEILGNEEHLSHLIDEFDIFGGIIAVGDNYVRHMLVKKIKNLHKDFNFVNCIHPSAQIAYDVVIGEGNAIMPGTSINTSTVIGNHCIINTNCSVDHDNLIKDFISFAPNSSSGGNTSVGQFSAIGIGAALSHNIKIAQNCIIGANSYVNNSTEADSIYYGSPARYIRKHELGEKYL